MPEPDVQRIGRRAPVRGALRCALCALSAVLALAGCGGAQHASVPPTRAPLESIFQADLALRANPVGTLDTLHRLGVSRVKVYLSWRSVAPDAQAHQAPSGFRADDPAAYPAGGWTPYDTILRDARARGIKVDLTVGPPAPVWATGAGDPQQPPSGVWKPSAPDFGAFMRAVARRYSGTYAPVGGGGALPRVDFWALWNEPNYGPSLAPQAVGSTIELSPNLYRGLIDAAWSALRATGHGSDTILIGELAPRGQTVGDQPGNYSGMVPLRFVRALYCVDGQFKRLSGAAATARGCPASGSRASFVAAHPALFRAPGFSVHPYPQGRIPPNVPTTIEPDYADMAALPNLERTVDRAQSAYGSFTPFAIYSTEFGYKTDPPYAAGAPVASAALFLNWAEYLSWRDPRIRSYDQYLLNDPPPSSNSSFDTGLEYADGTPKPTFDAFRLPLYLPQARAQSGQAVELWGCARPAPYAAAQTHRAQTVNVEFARAAAGPFRVISTVTISDPEGYFDVRAKFPSTGFVRLAFTAPGGSPEHSRVAAVTIG